MAIPDAATVASMLAACNDYYSTLLRSGCADDVALDRTWDCYERAFYGDGQCFDPRDRLFESKLRKLREKGAAHALSELE